jgi:hypothetical protein
MLCGSHFCPFPPSLRWNNDHKPNLLPSTGWTVKLGCWVRWQSSNSSNGSVNKSSSLTEHPVLQHNKRWKTRTKAECNFSYRIFLHWFVVCIGHLLGLFLARATAHFCVGAIVNRWRQQMPYWLTARPLRCLNDYISNRPVGPRNQWWEHGDLPAFRTMAGFCNPVTSNENCCRLYRINKTHSKDAKGLVCSTVLVGFSVPCLIVVRLSMVAKAFIVRPASADEKILI